MSRKETSKQRSRGCRRRKCKLGKEKGMYFALNKATDFSNSLGIHIWILRVWQGHYVPIQYRDWWEEKKKKKKKKRGLKTSVLLFVFSLVYLVWGSLVYNTYHHVFQIICWRIGWKRDKVKEKKSKLLWNHENSQSKWHAMSAQLHQVWFWFPKTGPGSTMYIFMQVFKKFITVCLAITTLFTL